MSRHMGVAGNVHLAFSINRKGVARPYPQQHHHVRQGPTPTFDWSPELSPTNNPTKNTHTASTSTKKPTRPHRPHKGLPHFRATPLITATPTPMDVVCLINWRGLTFDHPPRHFMGQPNGGSPTYCCIPVVHPTGEWPRPTRSNKTCIFNMYMYSLHTGLRTRPQA